MISPLPLDRVPGAPRRGRLRLLQRALLVSVAVVLLVGGPVVQARAGEAPEDRVKVAFLYNFAKFADWPAGSFANSASPLNVCFLGGGPAGSALDSLREKRVGDRPIAVRTVGTMEEARGCQVLYRSDDRERRIRDELTTLGGESILTVGETEGFCEWGGIINFILVEGKVRFEINPDAAQRSGIRLSAQLLRLARIVSDEDRDP